MVDIQNDEGLEFLKDRLQDSSNASAIGLLKTASIDVDFDDIVDEAFADTENRLFPIFSPEMAAMSAMYMQTQEVPPLTKQACAGALKEWGINDLSVDMLTKEAGDNSIPDDLFLLPSAKKLPIIDEDTLQKSASTLIGNMANLNVAERIEASTNLYKIAIEQYGISRNDINDTVLRYAQETPCDLNKLAMSVTERWAETHEPGYKEVIQKIASLKDSISGSISFDKSVNAGIAYDIIMLDKKAGVLDIFDAVLDVHNSPYVEQENSLELEKSASENSVTIGRHTVSETELYKIAEDEFENAFPGLSSKLFEDGVMSIEKVENFAEEMPSSAVDALGSYLS